MYGLMMKLIKNGFLTSGYSIIRYIIKSSDDCNIWPKGVLSKNANK